MLSNVGFYDDIKNIIFATNDFTNRSLKVYFLVMSLYKKKYMLW